MVPSGNNETVFTYGAPQLKFGAGASDEIGYDLSTYGVRRVLVITDPGVAATGHPQRIAEQIAGYGIEARLFDRVHVEPTDASLVEAVDFARDGGPWDGFVAVGGGSSIDTAKAVNLLCSNPGELLDYVNVPVGRGRSPENVLAPLVAVPTTTGTGSESTTVCVLDVLEQHVKSGISHPRLRPTLAVVDPRLTLTQPACVTAACGMDILCHALESWTARPFDSFERKSPDQRVPYCGANPIGDMWAEKAMDLLASSFRAAVHHGENEAAREQMALAATFAGMGFGNAGVHIPHANAYPVAGRVKDFRPEGYPDEEPLVPHGMAVSLTAAEAFRFTFEASPERHVRAAQLLAPDAGRPADDRDFLPRVNVDLMKDISLPNGLAAVGYDEGDVDSLVEGTLKQQRLLATAPREATAEDLARILHRSLELWCPRPPWTGTRAGTSEPTWSRSCAGPGSATSTTPRSHVRCTPATRPSTGSCPGSSYGPGTPTSSSPPWRWRTPRGPPSPCAEPAPPSPGTPSAPASSWTPPGTSPASSTSTPRPAEPWWSPEPCTRPCSEPLAATACASARTPRRTRAARWEGWWATTPAGPGPSVTAGPRTTSSASTWSPSAASA